MTKSELLEWLEENPTTKENPEIELWLLPTQKVRVLPMYSNYTDKIYVDIELEQP